MSQGCLVAIGKLYHGNTFNRIFLFVLLFGRKRETYAGQTVHIFDAVKQSSEKKALRTVEADLLTDPATKCVSELFVDITVAHSYHVRIRQRR
jgi:hypothetical protein